MITGHRQVLAADGRGRHAAHLIFAHADFAAVVADDQANVVAGDRCLLATLKSGDRLLGITAFLGRDDYGSWRGDELQYDLGLFHTGGRDHDGEPVQADMFVAAGDLQADNDGREVMTAGGTVSAGRRSEYLWQIANLGSANPPKYTKDPRVEFDLCATFGPRFDNPTRLGILLFRIDLLPHGV